MKLVLLFTFSAVLFTNALPLENVKEQSNTKSLDPALSPHDLIEYYLYTRSNPTTAQRLYMHDEESIRASFFNPSDPTIVIAHGFLENHNSELNPTTRDGLDPAGSIWKFHPNRMRASDAIYVEGIHTSKEFGIQSNVGDVDFYPNGGEAQPGCLTPVCSHNRAWRLFAATVTYNHLEGRRCESFLQIISNLCLGDRLKMGNDDINKRGSGIYTLTTGLWYPF